VNEVIKTIIPYTSIEGFSLGVIGSNKYAGLDDLITSFASAIEDNKGNRFYKKINLQGFYLQSKKNQSVYAIKKDEVITIVKGQLINSVVFIKPDDYFTGKITTSIDMLIRDYETINEIKLPSDEVSNIKKIVRLKSKKILSHYLINNGFSDDFIQNINELIDIYTELNFKKRIPIEKINNLLSDDLKKAMIINKFFNKLVSNIGVDYNFFNIVISEINQIRDFSLINDYINNFNSIIN